jgi:hypothetical protein
MSFAKYTSQQNGQSVGNWSTCTNESINDWPTVPHNSSLIYVFSQYQSEALAFTVLLTIIGVLGIVENAFIIHVASAKRSFRGPVTNNAGHRKALIYYFMYNLGCADVLTSLACFLVVVQFYVDFFQQTWSCRLIRFFGFLFPAITMQILLVISMDRYYALVRPYHSTHIDTCKKLIRASWCSGFALTTVAIATYDVRRVCLNDHVYTRDCQPAENTLASILSLLFVLVIYLIPGKHMT